MNNNILCEDCFKSFLNKVQFKLHKKKWCYPDNTHINIQQSLITLKTYTNNTNNRNVGLICNKNIRRNFLREIRTLDRHSKKIQDYIIDIE